MISRVLRSCHPLTGEPKDGGKNIFEKAQFKGIMSKTQETYTDD